ncbi:MAG TPA: HAMP domain-containing sensor histidine kinase [Bryobacteraceae bacterium]|nr:HAMP domain-containing sensor histidine kinase [Bryobacteraceae bacterium]
MVHDLRNPVAGIYAAAEMLMDPDPAPTQVKRLASNIFSAAGRMRELLADLNSVARGNRPTAEICDIGEVIAAAFEAALAAKENDSVQMLLEVHAGIELPLERSRMERVFFKLIANALEAMPTGGKLRIACRKGKSCVLIELEDTALGFRAKFAIGCSNRSSRPVSLTVSVLGWPSAARQSSTTEATFGLNPLSALILLSAFRSTAEYGHLNQVGKESD